MKKLLLLSLIAPLSFSLTACGKSEEEQKEACIEKLYANPSPADLKKTEELRKEIEQYPACQNLSNKDFMKFDQKYPKKLEAKIANSNKALYAVPKEEEEAIENYKGQSLGNPDDPNF